MKGLCLWTAVISPLRRNWLLDESSLVSLLMNCLWCLSCLCFWRAVICFCLLPSSLPLPFHSIFFYIFPSFSHDKSIRIYNENHNDTITIIITISIIINIPNLHIKRREIKKNISHNSINFQDVWTAGKEDS